MVRKEMGFHMNTYIVKQKDLGSRMKSRSGGIFAAVSDKVLEADGVVYGCALDEQFHAYHDRATTKEERDRFRGSKYVQSDMKDAMKKALADLKDGKLVLFSGTPCQIAGMKAVCPAAYKEKLLCMDIVCHGVPSPRVWDDYKAYMQKKYHGKITAVDFRNKRNHGWWEHIESVKIHGIEVDSQIYKNLFYEHNILRDCCYDCPYKSLERVGDISIADAWGIAQAAPEFDDNHGVSLVICSTPKGQEWLEKGLQTCDYQECDIKEYMQEPLIRSFEKPENYERFWQEYFTKDFSEIVKARYEDSAKAHIKWRVKRIVKAVIPQSLINKIRGRE